MWLRRGFGVGLPFPEPSFEKLGPMRHWSVSHVTVTAGLIEQYCGRNRNVKGPDRSPKSCMSDYRESMAVGYMSVCCASDVTAPQSHFRLFYCSHAHGSCKVDGT